MVDKNEDILKAAKRELLEEAGYQAKKWILFDSSQLFSAIDWEMYTFIANDCQKTKKPILDPGEKIKLKTVTFDEFIKIVAQDNFRDKEISLKVFTMIGDPKKLKEMKKLLKRKEKDENHSFLP